MNVPKSSLFFFAGTPLALLFSFTPFWLFLTATVGMYHGAFDADLILQKDRRLSRRLLWFTAYLALALAFGLVWFVSPLAFFVLFILESYIHFGMGDATDKTLLKGEPLLRGGLPLALPALFHPEEVLLVLSPLLQGQQAAHLALNMMQSLAFPALIGCVLMIKNHLFKRLHLVECLCFFLLFYFCTPLIAFSAYFVFLHSTRHMEELSAPSISLISLLAAATPVLFYGSTLYGLLPPLDLSFSVYLLIALGALTFPHLAFSSILLKKN